MAATNAQVADLLRKYSSVLVLQRADRFKIKAYRRAADTIEMLSTDIADLVSGGADLKKLPGIGPAISGVIRDIVKTGTFARFEESSSQLQPELLELASWPLLDPQRVKRIYKKLKISTIGDLRRLLQEGTIREQFGSRMDYHIRHGLDDRPRMLLYHAEALRTRIEEFGQSLPGVSQIVAAGSLRRKKDTVGDLNFVVTGRSASAIFKQFAKFGGKPVPELQTKSKSVFKLSTGMHVTLTFTPKRRLGITLLEQTGSAEHLSDLQEYAKRAGFESLISKDVDAAKEETIYQRLDLPWIEPELREGRGEVGAAAKGKLPRLLRLEDLKGDLHMHTVASDGANEIMEMVEGARKRGYEYIGITDHSQSLKITNGLTEKRLRKQLETIDELNANLKDFTILKSAEVDILEDGRLDYSNSMLKQLDYAICSIHSRFGLNSQQQTDRIRRAMDNPYFTILGHATGRLLLKREGYGPDMEKLLRHAKQVGCFVEINSSPDRLDLSDVDAKLAKEIGVKVAVNTDAHSLGELDFITAGLNQARRAWLEPRDILNTLPWSKLQKIFTR